MSRVGLETFKKFEINECIRYDDGDRDFFYGVVLEDRGGLTLIVVNALTGSHQTVQRKHIESVTYDEFMAAEPRRQRINIA